MVTKTELSKLLKREFATTLKVMRAFPENKLDFTPHERSSNVRKLLSTCIFEMFLMKSLVFGEHIDNSIYKTYSPDSVKILVEDFEKETSDIVSKLEALPESELNKEINFAGREIIADEFMMMMLFDQIHHRGQMSVYIRLAGGKVPSIYGPSADDPGENT